MGYRQKATLKEITLNDLTGNISPGIKLQEKNDKIFSRPTDNFAALQSGSFFRRCREAKALALRTNLLEF